MDAAGRLLENRPAGYVSTGHRRRILRDENLTLFAAGDGRVAEQSNPVAGRSGQIWTYVSDEQVALARRGAKAAQALAREIVLVRTKVGVSAGQRTWLDSYVIG